MPKCMPPQINSATEVLFFKQVTTTFIYYLTGVEKEAFKIPWKWNWIRLSDCAYCWSGCMCVRYSALWTITISRNRRIFLFAYTYCGCFWLRPMCCVIRPINLLHGSNLYINTCFVLSMPKFLLFPYFWPIPINLTPRPSPDLRLYVCHSSLSFWTTLSLCMRFFFHLVCWQTNSQSIWQWVRLPRESKRFCARLPKEPEASYTHIFRMSALIKPH